LYLRGRTRKILILIEPVIQKKSNSKGLKIEQSKPVRIKDIADKAGVSAGTVDRVLHKRGRVSSESVKKVKDALVLLDYEPNIIARGLGSKNTFNLAVIVPEYDKDSYWRSQVKGVLIALKQLKDFGFSIEILTFSVSIENDLLKHKASVSNLKFDALLLAPVVSDNSHELMDLSNELGIPYLLINTNLERADNNCLGFVGQDSLQSGKLGAKLLSLMTSPDSQLGILHMEKEFEKSYHMIQKQKGFLAYFQKGGHQDKDIVVDHLDLSLSDKSVLVKSISNFLIKNKRLKGIFVTTSRMHFLVEVLNKLERSDIVLVGYDLIKENIDALSKYDQLVLINQNPERQAFQGIMSLFEHLFNKKEISKSQYLPMDIITKENISAYIQSDNSLHSF